jgi:hypothetical protein
MGKRRQPQVYKSIIVDAPSTMRKKVVIDLNAGKKAKRRRALPGYICVKEFIPSSPPGAKFQD